MPKKGSRGGSCSVEGCDRPVKGRRYCLNHYQLWRRNGAPEAKVRDKRSHPLYSIWFERKQRGSLCAAWAADLWAFVDAVGERPSPTHLLRTLRHDEPYGPDNFVWLAALKREEGESVKAFNARKWQARKRAHPQFEPNRSLRRKYNITREDYDRMYAEQDGKCAICRKTESAHHQTTGAPRALAVDHNAETGEVRGLLCFRCNTSIGKFEHDPELLRRAALFCERKLLIIIESDGS